MLGAWFAFGLRASTRPEFWGRTAVCAAIGAGLLATWFAWSLSVYGVSTTFLSNSSVSVPEAHEGNQVVKIALNLRDSIVPHFLRSLDRTLIEQRSVWGGWRDWWFQLYQVNLLFAFGVLAWVTIARELIRAAKHNAQPRTTLTASTGIKGQRGFWVWFVGGAIVLGIAVHGARDTWGLTHICLQSLVVLGLAFLAARWQSLSMGWRMLTLAGATADFWLGIFLNFGVQNFAFDRWFSPEGSTVNTLTSYSSSALMNLRGKVVGHLTFVADVVPAPFALVLALLGAVLTLALVRAGRSSHGPA
jgi:hypothetical protein